MQKQKVLEVIDALPEDVDIDALMEKLYLLHKIEVGEKQIANDEGITHEDAKIRLEQCLT